MKESLIPVDPVRPVAPWIGGKRNLAKRICAAIEALPQEVDGIDIAQTRQMALVQPYQLHTSAKILRKLSS